MLGYKVGWISGMARLTVVRPSHHIPKDEVGTDLADNVTYNVCTL